MSKAFMNHNQKRKSWKFTSRGLCFWFCSVLAAIDVELIVDDRDYDMLEDQVSYGSEM